METYKTEVVDPETFESKGVVDTGVPKLLVDNLLSVAVSMDLLTSPLIVDSVTGGVKFLIMEHRIPGGDVSKKYKVTIEAHKA